MLLPELAEKIVAEVKKLIDEDIIVVNTNGYIIASTDKGRINSFHEGALIASKQKNKLIITEKDQQRLTGVKAGINFPIFFQKDVIGVIGITGEPQKVNSFGEIVRKMTELLISENYYAEQFDWQSRALETFVIDWVQGKEWDSSFHTRASLFSMDLSCRRTAAIIEFPSLERPLPRESWNSIFNRLQGNKNDLAVRWGNDRIVLLLNSSAGLKKELIQRRLVKFLFYIKKQFSISAIAGVGQEADSQHVKESYRQAERALRIAKQGLEVVFDEDLTLEMLTDEITSKTKEEFIVRTIGPIIADKELLGTLKELFKQNRSLKSTSESLHIHINTLHYRLKKVEDLTGLNPGEVKDFINIYLAMQFLDEHTKIKWNNGYFLDINT